MKNLKELKNINGSGFGGCDGCASAELAAGFNIWRLELNLDMTILEFIKYKRKETLLILIILIFSIISFYKSVTSPSKAASILFLISTILAVCGNVYNINYYYKKYIK